MVPSTSAHSTHQNSLAVAASTKAGIAARQKEDEKLIQSDASSTSPVAFRHRLVPCVVEEGRGRLGGHFQALLKELAERSVSSGVLAAPASWSPVPPSVVVSQWIGTWRSRISTWLHSSLSLRLLRSCHRDQLS